MYGYKNINFFIGSAIKVLSIDFNLWYIVFLPHAETSASQIKLNRRDRKECVERSKHIHKKHHFIS